MPKENILLIDDTYENIEVARQRGWNVCLASALNFEKIKESVNKFLKK